MTNDHSPSSREPDSTAPPAPAPPAPATSLAKTTGSGAAWMIAGTVLGKLTSFLCQAVVGWILTDGDFGVFATAAAVAGFIAICRDAGVGQYLVQRGPGEYPTLSGPLFWLALAFNSLAGLLIAAAAVPLATRVYEMPEMIPVLLVMAVTVPLGTPASILGAKLRLDLRFRDISRFGLISVAIRYLLTIVLAVLFGDSIGALCLAIPMLVTTVLDTIICAWLTKDSPWTRGIGLRVWWSTLTSTKWLMFGSVSNFALDMGPNLILGALLHKSAVGLYYFAFQITAQLGVLLSWNLQQVLSAVLARIANDPARMRDAVLRSLRAQMLLGSAACLALGATFPMIEQLVWHGRWSESALIVLALSVFFPWRISYGLSTAVQLATQRYRGYALLTFFEGVGFILAAGLGAAWVAGQRAPVGDEALTVAIACGSWLLVSRFVVTLGVLRAVGISPAHAAMTMLPSWALALMVGALVLNADARFDLASAILALVPDSFRTGVVGLATHTLAHGTHALAIGMACAVLFGVLLRTRLERDLRDTVSVLPGRLRTLASRAMVLREPPPPPT